MERRNITISNEDIVHALSSFSWRTGYAIYVISGTGYISDAILFSLTSHYHRRYQGFRRIDNISGHFEPTNPNGGNENGSIQVKLASVEVSRAALLVPYNTVHLEILLVWRQPPQPPRVLGRRRVQADPW